MYVWQKREKVKINENLKFHRFHHSDFQSPAKIQYPELDLRSQSSGIVAQEGRYKICWIFQKISVKSGYQLLKSDNLALRSLLEFDRQDAPDPLFPSTDSQVIRLKGM